MSALLPNEGQHLAEKRPQFASLVSRLTKSLEGRVRWH
jgi:hypothetical protein